MPDILADIFRNNQPAVPPVIDQDDTISKLFRGELDEVNPIPELPPAPAPVTNPPVPEFSRGPVQFGQPKRYTVNQILAGELPQQGSTEDLIREFPESEKDITRMEKDGRTVGTIRQVVEAGLGAGYQGQGTRDGGEGDEYTPDLLHKRERLDIIEGDLQVLTDKAQQRPLLPSEISDYQQLQGEYQQLAEFFQNPDVIRQYRKISPDTIDELGKMGLIIPKSKDEMTYTQGGIWQPQSVEKPHAWWDTRTEQFVDPVRAAENQENIDGNARYVLLDLEEGFSPELLQGFARSAKQVIDTLIGGGMRVAGDIIEGATPNLSLPSARGVQLPIGPEVDAGKAREALHAGAESLQESTQQIFRPEQPTGYYARPPEGLQDAINKFPQLAIDQGPLFAAFMLATQLNPALGMGVMFAAEGGEASERVREYEKKSGTTVDPKKRMAMVTAVGGINAALERIGIEAMFGRMGWTKRLQKQFLGRLTDVLLRTLVESGTEGLQGGIQRINEAFYNEFKRDNIPEEVISRFNQEFWSTIPISVLAAGGSVTGESIAGNQQELAQRQADYQAINDIYGITNRQAGQEFGLADAERIRKETKAGVVVPESGAPDKAGGDNLVRMEAGQQVAELKKLGYSDTLIPFFSRDQRDKIIADQIKPVNLPAELQPVKPRRKPVSERPIREQLDRLDAMEKRQDEIEKRFAEQEKPSAPESPGVLPGERPPV
ncbi:MAG: hypothetical protein H8E14_15220, partial [Candidatus Marinimicrobia bacterium]|nr:hypothetical protein [Candidatus Neomarinimicrobiota bacterium]